MRSGLFLWSAVGFALVMAIVVSFREVEGLLNRPGFTGIGVSASWCVVFGLYYLLADGAGTTFLKFLGAISAAYFGVALVFIIWSFAGLSNLAVPAPERFPYTFSLWDALPVSQHFFMVFDMRWWQYEKGICYHGYTPLYAISHYVVFKVIGAFTSLPYIKTIRFTPFIYGFLYSVVIPLCTSYRMQSFEKTRLANLFWLCVPLLMVLSVPDLWTALIKYESDNSFPLIALGGYVTACLLARALHDDSKQSWVLWFAFLIFFGLYIPVAAALMAPILAMTYLSKRHAYVLTGAFVIGLVAIAAYLLTWQIANFAGFTFAGTGLISRAGLDQSSGFDSSAGIVGVVKAFLYPTNQFFYRKYSFVFIGGAIGLLSSVLAAHGALRRTSAPLVFVLIGPLILDLVIFPQSHSIHPYLYDIPISVLGPLSLYWLTTGEGEEEIEKNQNSQPWVALFFTSCALCNFIILRVFLNS